MGVRRSRTRRRPPQPVAFRDREPLPRGYLRIRKSDLLALTVPADVTKLVTYGRNRIGDPVSKQIANSIFFAGTARIGLYINRFRSFSTPLFRKPHFRRYGGAIETNPYVRRTAS